MTAGASAPEMLVQGVLEGLRQFGEIDVSTLAGVAEDVRFRFPPASEPTREDQRMAVPLNQALRVGAYVLKQHLIGRKRYPLVLMLEPLFRCNLACAGCGKIDYPAEILNQRLSVARMPGRGRRVRRAGGGASPAASRCCTRRSSRSSRASIARKKFVIVCTNALLLEKKMHLFKPSNSSPGRCIWTAAGGARHSVCQDGVYDRAVAAIAAAKQARLPHHHQLHAVQQRRARAASRRSSMT